MTFIQNMHRCRGFKLTFADWLKFSLMEEKILTNDALDLIGSPAA
jgi:hypothetical protein